MSEGPHQYLFVSNSNPNGNRPGTWAITGEIYKMELDGTILGKFGHASKEFGGFQVVHMMDCRNPNEIVVGEIESWRVQKLILEAAGRAEPSTARIAATTSGETPMKRLLPLLLTAAALCGAVTRRRPEPRRRKSPSTPSPIALTLPDDIYLGEVGGVATNSKGDIFVYTRTGHPTVTLGTARGVRARRLAPVPVRSQRQVRPRDRQGHLRLHVSPSRCASIRRTTSGWSIR